MNNFKARQWVPDVETPDGNNVIAAHWHIWGLRNDCEDQPYTAPMCDIFDSTYPESFQSTGLHDSKGVEIWEGSVVRFSLWREETTILIGRGFVEWDRGRLGWIILTVDKDGRAAGLGIGGRTITVIGDTTTTPELMEVVK